MTRGLCFLLNFSLKLTSYFKTRFLLIALKIKIDILEIIENRNSLIKIKTC